MKLFDKQSTPPAGRVIGGRPIHALAAALVMAAAARQLPALDPQQVLVVANAASKESLDLAESYMQARAIPGINLVTVETTTGYSVSREDYDTRIAAPLTRALAERKLRGKIRCICLIWGMPVRVWGSMADDSPNAIRAACSKAAADAHRRMAVDYLLTGRVGRRFPRPAGKDLSPLASLFTAPAPEAPAKLLSMVDVARNLNRRLRLLQASVDRIADPAKRRIAARQLMALHLDAYGLRGLMRHIRQAGPPGAPNPDQLKRRLAEAERKLRLLPAAADTAGNLKARLALLGLTGGLEAVYEDANQQRKRIKAPMDDAAVDSELALLAWPKYPLARMLANPAYWGKSRRRSGRGRGGRPIFLTARIDGPTPADARRIIESSMAAEKAGLSGVFYIDAGAMRNMLKKPQYARYDRRLTALYLFARSNTKLKVVLDQKPSVFQPGSCPRAALYVGWYSLKRYVPAFDWQPGAVGWHVASFEAAALRDATSSQWCGQMIQNGVAATVGAVGEPYLSTFPAPEEFFPLLLTGQWTLAECYWRTVPAVSWRLTLIGDPLYNPFKNRPQTAADRLPSGLAPRGPVG